MLMCGQDIIKKLLYSNAVIHFYCTLEVVGGSMEVKLILEEWLNDQ